MKDVAGWAMLLFLLNEATLFAGLIASYFYLGVANRAWPPIGVEKPAVLFPLGMTVVLVSSSVVLAYAERGFKRGERGRYRAGTVVAMALGAVFLAMQAMEYREKLPHLAPSQNAYASMFYSITGLHGTHVAFGLLFLAWALLREMKGTVSGERSAAIRNASLYWHFVDGVWLVVFTSLYLSPRWS